MENSNDFGDAKSKIEWQHQEVEDLMLCIEQIQADADKKDALDRSQEVPTPAFRDQEKNLHEFVENFVPLETSVE